MRKYLFTWILFLSCTLTAFAQNEVLQITGIVKDELNEPMIGVNVTIKDNPGLGAITDMDGRYKIKAKGFEVLVFSYIGYDKLEVPIRDRQVINLQMKPSENNVLDEVTVTGTGIQKKATVTGAITTVDVNTLKHSAGGSISINNTLAGNVSGVIARQNSGQPGQDTSEFWIRGISTFGASQSALILVDGFQRDMAELNIEDIASFSVLKDASATAIYGSKGANGVVLITTKQGHSGKVKIDAKVETTYNTRTRTPEYVDAYSYASMMNEALITRNREPKYTPKELEIIRMGLDQDLYPNVDWQDVLLKDGAWSKTAKLNLSGGGTTARYFLSGSYTDNDGMYKTDETLKNQYKTNANMKRWNYRMNVNLDLTKSTQVQVGLSGNLIKENLPGQSSRVWESIVGQNPISIPLIYSNGKVPATGKEDTRLSPWMNATQTGYQEYWENNMQTNISLEQKLNFITKGLKFVARFGFDTSNTNTNKRIKRPEIFHAEDRRDQNGELVMKHLANEVIMYQESSNDGNRTESLEAELHYNRDFKNIHQIGATLKYSQYEKIQTQNVGGDIMKAISRRNQGVSGRLTYGLLGRYFAEFNFGYTGSENFSHGHQFGFFPAVSAGWNIAEEKFMKKHLPWMEMFKIRYSYGEVGNDNIERRFPYLTEFAPFYQDNDSNKPAIEWIFGDYGNDNKYTTYHYSYVASPNLSWEIAKKHNLGLDVSILNGKFSATVDLFKDTRESIFMRRGFLPEIIGLASQPWANVGKMQSIGADGNLAFRHKFGEFDFTLRGNFTLTKNEVLEYDEEANAYPYKMTSGFRYQQERGLIAEGLFKDYEDIRTSPYQTFGEYAPGDIKYKDVNGDGVIDGNDEVPVGATRTPSAIYGIGASLQWRGLDINVHFQGAGKSAYMLNGSSIYAFQNGDWGNILTDLEKPGNRWISRDISGTPDTENPNAKYPRLSYGGQNNNYRFSTFWLENGSYLRFKTLEIGYTIPKKFVNKLFMNDVRIYFLGSNLLVWDSLKLWDPELASGNGASYPIAKSFTLGLNVNF